MDPYPIDGTPRTQLESYHKELAWLREENAKLKGELNELRGQVWWQRTDFMNALRNFRNIGALLSVFLWIVTLVSYLSDKFLFKQTC